MDKSWLGTLDEELVMGSLLVSKKIKIEIMSWLDHCVCGLRKVKGCFYLGAKLSILTVIAHKTGYGLS